jgi:tRNA threonylcarbamoyladenosine biosynthesis protein TsaB
LNYPLLALDAASGKSFACLLLSDEQEFFAESEGDRGHSQSLMPVLEGLLNQANITWKDLTMLALGVGPGSFTGLRIAAATLAGINASLQLPVLSVSSLAVTAARANHEEPLWVLEDARAGEVHIGHYYSLAIMQDDVCVSWDRLNAMTPSCYASEAEPPVALDGWSRLSLKLGRSEALATVVRSALMHTELKNLPIYVQPAYLQMSQAEKTQLERFKGESAQPVKKNL